PARGQRQRPHRAAGSRGGRALVEGIDAPAAAARRVGRLVVRTPGRHALRADPAQGVMGTASAPHLVRSDTGDPHPRVSLSFVRRAAGLLGVLALAFAIAAAGVSGAEAAKKKKSASSKKKSSS